ncbi:GIY-YIG nuclease family protein [uncultured Kocuria sp.]|uniref:GIY-YIG nuclease family protein n=1 Tax=uncultured Kocuria sp. TaxID=259305 RepID=UPI0025982158|nr:GIY-YIG nuclease family protein [uncultured Kocuria sp.]MCT1367193.1 GIY-YIG nuclease family protein [Rothia sp. p3-SID1597]
MSGKHIELFLVDGVSGGLTTAEIAGWTGHVLAGPRADLASVLRRPEASRNGCYLLLADDDAAVGGTRCYVGKTENFVDRMKQHESKKVFWDKVVLITSKDDGFNEGHWGYLEASLVSIAKEAKRASLENTQTPQTRKLSEAQMSDMEAFLGQLQVVLPVLGVSTFKMRPVQKMLLDLEPSKTSSPIFSLVKEKRGVNAQAQLAGGDFTVLEGSLVVGTWSGSGRAESTQRAYKAYKAHHERLVADGSIALQENGIGRLTRDVPFSSPSTAGAIVTGASCNGRKAWTSEHGDFGTWEARGIDRD